MHCTYRVSLLLFQSSSPSCFTVAVVVVVAAVVVAGGYILVQSTLSLDAFDDSVDDVNDAV